MTIRRSLLRSQFEAATFSFRNLIQKILKRGAKSEMRAKIVNAAEIGRVKKMERLP